MIKHLKKHSVILVLFLIGSSEAHVIAQTQKVNGVFTNITLASQTPMQVEILDLSNQHFARLPKEVFNFVNLRKLYLNDTQIEYLSDSIEVFTHLSVLELNHLGKSNKRFTRFPDSFVKLKKLETVGLIGLHNLDWVSTVYFLQQLPVINNLALMKNNLRELPAGIEKLTTLEQIWLGGNLELDPSEVFDKLPFIKQVGFGGSELAKLPENISNAKELYNMWLAGNRLTSVVELKNNSEMRSIALNGNQLLNLPEGLTLLNLSIISLDNNPKMNWDSAISDLATMKSLKSLSLNNNMLSVIPKGVERLTLLERLSLTGNKFSQEDKERIIKMLPTTKVKF